MESELTQLYGKAVEVERWQASRYPPFSTIPISSSSDNVSK
jgi:hypothetical protein